MDTYLRVIDWNVVTSIFTTLMTFLAGATLWINYKWRRDDYRARLAFEIVSWNNLFLLKVTNIGKETCYNANLKISGKPIDEHFSEEIRNEFKGLNGIKLTLSPNRTLYFYLSPVYSQKGGTVRIGKEEYPWQKINNWLDNYIDRDIHIFGIYNNRYKIKESFSMKSFIGCKSIVVETPTEIALQEISKGLVCKNSFHKTIQQSLEGINEKLERNKYEVS